MLLRKGVYPYECIDEWDKFNEKVLPSKESFYSNLTLESISEIDYAHANNVFKKFNINNLGNIMIFMLELIRCYLRIYSKILDNLV